MSRKIKFLSEFESKILLKEYSIPVVKERLVREEKDLFNALDEIGYPVVLKGISSKILHKTEYGLVYKDLRSREEVISAFYDIFNKLPSDGRVLVQEYIKGDREIVVGMIRDPLFGPCVMFGLGGIFLEIFKEVSFRLAPLEIEDAKEMIFETKAAELLKSIRGIPAADIEAIADIIVKIGILGLNKKDIKEIDLNPIIISDSNSKPIVVDALIVVEEKS